MAQETKEPATKTERLREFMDSCLRDDIDSLQGFPLKETSINLGMGILMLLMAALHLIYAVCQFAFSLVAAISDLLVKGLVKIMPAPKMAKNPSKEEV